MPTMKCMPRSGKGRSGREDRALRPGGRFAEVGDCPILGSVNGASVYHF